SNTIVPQGLSLLAESEVDVDCSDHRYRVSVQQGGFIDPLARSLHGGGNQQRRPGCKAQILDVTIGADGRFESDRALNSGFFRVWRVHWHGLAYQVRLGDVSSHADR